MTFLLKRTTSSTKNYNLNFFRLCLNRLVIPFICADNILSRYSTEYAPQFMSFWDIILWSVTASREFKCKKQFNLI